MQPEELLVLRQLLSAVEDIGSTLKFLSSHLVTKRNTSTWNHDRGQFTQPAGGTVDSHTAHYGDTFHSPAGSLHRLSEMDDQSDSGNMLAHASSQFMDGNNEQLFEVGTAEETGITPSVSGAATEECLEECPVVIKQEDLLEEKEDMDGQAVSCFSKQWSDEPDCSISDSLYSGDNPEPPVECVLAEKAVEERRLTIREKNGCEKKEYLPWQAAHFRTLPSNVVLPPEMLLRAASQRVGGEHELEKDCVHHRDDSTHLQASRIFGSVGSAAGHGSSPGVRLQVKASAMKQHPCGYCHKVFTWPSQLSRHVKTHTGERPFECMECSKSFSQREHLKQHMLLHGSMKPFPCDQCSASFTTKQNLNSHLLVHSGEKPFICERCGKGFTQGGTLKKHMLVHWE